MTSQEAMIHQYALRRLAEVFHVSVESLLLDMKFGKELKAGPVSCFTENEFDLIDNDIRDVADNAILKEMALGLLEIRTVQDYCKHMLRCNTVNPVDVARQLQLPNNE